MDDPQQWVSRYVLFEGQKMRLEYSGPPLEHLRTLPNARVIVAFGPVDYPFLSEAGGWGSRSFTKRAIPHVCVFHREEDWHQNDEFFDAMQACVDHLGPDIAVTTYGFSMGGYGALLAARVLQADHTVAVSPQVSIDPSVVRFERRYTQQWAALGRWQHDLGAQMSQDRARHVILFDPMHRQDRRHEALLPKTDRYERCLMHGVGHAAIQAMVEMDIHEVFFDLLQNRTSAAKLRCAFRQRRAHGFRYLRKVGTRLHNKNHPKARMFFDMARARHFRRLTKKWRPHYERPAARASSPERQ